ncbi:MAG: ATP-grasp domain-containing protein [Anaeroplasma sp.]
MKKALFITDECENRKEYSIKRKDGEGNSLSAKNEMIDALNKIFDSVYVTYSVTDACEYITNNKDAFVITTYYGIAESDSKSIIPSICKANHTKYWGADPYTHIICNDKYLSKAYIKHFGLIPVPGIIIYSPDNETEFDEIMNLNFPVVVKPNFGGGSNGISEESVKYNFEETKEYVKKLYSYQKMPILIEEYIPGYEISFVIIGNKNEILLSNETQLVLNNKSFFSFEIYGLETKKIDKSKKRYIHSNLIDDINKEKMIKLFQSFDKVEFMRIDCRIDINNKLYIMELSPDCSVASSGMFYSAIKDCGISYDEMIKILIDNSMNNQNY